MINDLSEIKNVLNEKCNDSWEMLEIMESMYGRNSVQWEKAGIKWVTYVDLFRELYNESPLYSSLNT